MFKKLIKIHKEKEELEIFITKQKEKFNLSIIDKTNRLNNLKDKEDSLKQQVIETLKKNNETNVEIDNQVIIKQVRKTLQIEDPTILYSKVKSIPMNIITQLGIDYKKLLNSFENTIIVKDKKLVMDVIQKYENVEGKYLDGVHQQKTEFLIIKNK